MRNYLILKEKARQFDEDQEIQALLAEIRNGAETSRAAWPVQPRKRRSESRSFRSIARS